MRWAGGWLGRWVGGWLGLASSTTAPADTGPTVRIGSGGVGEARASTRARSYGPTNPIRFPSDEEQARDRRKRADMAVAAFVVFEDDDY